MFFATVTLTPHSESDASPYTLSHEHTKKCSIGTIPIGTTALALNGNSMLKYIGTQLRCPQESFAPGVNPTLSTLKIPSPC
jgi:hypothetical protein